MAATARRRDSESEFPRRRYFRIGILVIVALAVITYLSFVKGIPLRPQFEVKAVFSTSNQLEPGSDVRLAGLRIGEVAKTEPGPVGTTVVTLKIQNRDIPMRSDARLEIKPRLALEGNFYVKVSPGTPSAPELQDGDMVPLERTAVPVQLDQVFDVLDKPTRAAMKGTIAVFAQGLGPAGPGPLPPAGSGAEGLRRAFRELDRSLGSVTQVSRALQGTRPGDLGRAVRSTGDMTAQLASDPRAMADFVTNYNRVLSALADNERALGETIREANGVLRGAPASLRSIDAALPGLSSFSAALRPSLAALPATLRKADAAFVQVDGLTGERELPALLRGLAPATANLPVLTRRLRALFPQLDVLTKCVSRNVVPALNQKLEDGPHTLDQPAWQEFLHMAAGLAGIAQATDGNGSTLRLGVTADDNALALNLPGYGEVFGRGSMVGVSPQWLGMNVDPPHRPELRCIDQKVANLNEPSRRGGPAEGIVNFTPKTSPTARRAIEAIAARDTPTLLKTLESLGKKK